MEVVKILFTDPGKDSKEPGPEKKAGHNKAGSFKKVPPHIFAVLMLGLGSQVGQVLLLRELLMVFHGNELSIGLILAAWMFWVGIGSNLGAALAGRVGRSLMLLIASAIGVLLTLPATIVLIRILRSFFDLPPGAHLSLIDIGLSCLLVMAPACLLLGAQFVFLSRIWRELEGSEDTSGAGKTYIGEAAGNMLGGVIFTFLLVHYLNAFQVAFLVGFFMLAAAYYTIRKSRSSSSVFPGKKHLAVAVLLLLTVFTAPFLEELDRWSYRLQWRYFTPAHELIEVRQSEHGAISVLGREDQYTFYQSGNLIFSTAGPKAITPAFEEQEAVELAHLVMAQHENPERVLLIGGGLRGLLGEILEHPVEQVDYVELDPVLTETARPYVSKSTIEALNDPRVNLIHADGRLLVKTTDRKYDMVFVDMPDPATAELNRFYTREFFAEAKNILEEDGVLATGVVSTPDLRGTALANRNAAMYHTINSEFDRVLPAGERFMSFFASDDPDQVTLDVNTLEERFIERGIEVEGFSPHHYRVMLEEGQLQRVNWIVRNHGRSAAAHLEGPPAAPISPGTVQEQEAAEQELPPVEERYFINTDFEPIGYYYTLMFFDQITRPQEDFTLGWFLQVQPWWVLPLCLVPLLAVIALRLVPGRVKSRIKDNQKDTSFAVLFSVFTTGFSTMMLQIALIFSFQSVYGFVYETVGLIVAIFMGGLALGSYLTNRYVKYKASLNLLAAMQLIIALLAGLIALALPRAAAVDSPVVIFALFSLLTFSAGLINGIDFPLSLACYKALGIKAEKTAGKVYGFELFGACLGAIIASAVVAPILGIIACCIFAGIVNFTAFVVLLLGRRDQPWLKEVSQAS